MAMEKALARQANGFSVSSKQQLARQTCLLTKLALFAAMTREMTAEEQMQWVEVLSVYQSEDVEAGLRQFTTEANREQARGVVLGDIVKLVRGISCERRAEREAQEREDRQEQWRREREQHPELFISAEDIAELNTRISSVASNKNLNHVERPYPTQAFGAFCFLRAATQTEGITREAFNILTGLSLELLAEADRSLHGKISAAMPDKRAGTLCDCCRETEGWIAVGNAVKRCDHKPEPEDHKLKAAGQ